MRYITFLPPDGNARAGVLLGDLVVDLAAAAPLVIEEPSASGWDLLSLIQGSNPLMNLDVAGELVAALIQMLGAEAELLDRPAGLGESGFFEQLALDGSLSLGGATMLYPLQQVGLLAPLPRPSSLRLFQAFEEHAIARASLRGQTLASAWYRGPSFAFANHGAIYGPEQIIAHPNAEELDYGLGLGCVIGRSVRDIAASEAPSAIAGYLIINSWTSHAYEADELALGSGPAKSRDFATSLGPWLVTPDELEFYADDEGRLSLTLTAQVNGSERSRATAATQYYPFAELIAHASRNATLYPGDIIASGPVGGGSLYEWSSAMGPWLNPGDSVELAVTGLGVLRNELE